MNNNELIKNKIDQMKDSAVDFIYGVFFDKKIKKSFTAKRKILCELLTSDSLTAVRERAVNDLTTLLFKYDDLNCTEFIIKLGEFFIEYFYGEGKAKHI